MSNLEKALSKAARDQGATAAYNRINGVKAKRNPHKSSSGLFWAWHGGFNRVWDKRPEHMITC